RSSRRPACWHRLPRRRRDCSDAASAAPHVHNSGDSSSFRRDLGMAGVCWQDLRSYELRPTGREPLMLYSSIPAHEKRRAFRERLATGELPRFPGAFNPLSARLVEQKGFEGVYISGAVLSADLGLPDIGLTTLTEVAGRGAQIARMTDLPAII